MHTIKVLAKCLLKLIRLGIVEDIRVVQTKINADVDEEFSFPKTGIDIQTFIYLRRLSVKINLVQIVLWTSHRLQ